MLPAQLEAELLRKMVAIALQQVICVALIVPPQLVHHLMHLLLRHLRVPYDHALPVHHCMRTRVVVILQNFLYI